MFVLVVVVVRLPCVRSFVFSVNLILQRRTPQPIDLDGIVAVRVGLSLCFTFTLNSSSSSVLPISLSFTITTRLFGSVSGQCTAPLCIVVNGGGSIYNRNRTEGIQPFMLYCELVRLDEGV